MSENRSSYSSAPLQDLKRRPPASPPNGAAIKSNPVATPRQGSFVLLQMMLVVVLPLAFIISLFIKDVQVHRTYAIIYILASLACLGAMFLLKAFVHNARQVLGVIHSAMIAVVIFALIVGIATKPDARTVTAQDYQSIFNEDTSASIVAMSEGQQTGQEEVVTTPNPGAASLAQQKLEQFMAAWGSKDYATMVALSSPNWTNQYENNNDAQTGMFHLSAIRRPVSYQISDVSGSDSDQTRTITMQAAIDRSDGKEPQLYNFQILMIRSNNEWFVDPNSISSSQVVQQQITTIQDQGTQALAEEQTSNIGAIGAIATPNINTTRSDTLLYYNQDGGEYYHLDPNCSSLGAKYKPLTASFYYRDVSNDTFKNLKTCPHCNAPARP